MSDFPNFTAAHDLVERLRNFSSDSPYGQALTAEAANMIELLAHRINHLTNTNDGLRETLDRQRAGLAELKAMLLTGKPA